MNQYSNDATPIPDSGESAEKLAFNFCKAATLMLITIPLGKFALPFVAATASILFLVAHFRGASSTRCILNKPLYVSAFWAIIAVATLWLAAR